MRYNIPYIKKHLEIGLGALLRLKCYPQVIHIMGNIVSIEILSLI